MNDPGGHPPSSLRGGLKVMELNPALLAINMRLC
jgi:hypothetical protein